MTQGYTGIGRLCRIACSADCVVGGTTTFYIFSGTKVIAEYVNGALSKEYIYSGAVVMAEKTGSTWTDYIFFGNQRIAQQSGSTASTANYLHTDHLGSTRVCTNGSGASNGTCDYEPFGELQPGSSCSVPTNYRFAGAETLLRS